MPIEGDAADRAAGGDRGARVASPFEARLLGRDPALVLQLAGVETNGQTGCDVDTTASAHSSRIHALRLTRVTAGLSIHSLKCPLDLAEMAHLSVGYRRGEDQRMERNVITVAEAARLIGRSRWATRKLIERSEGRIKRLYDANGYTYHVRVDEVRAEARRVPARRRAR